MLRFILARTTRSYWTQGMANHNLRFRWCRFSGLLGLVSRRG